MMCYLTARLLAVAIVSRAADPAAGSGNQLRLITPDPVYFHAAQMHTGPLVGFSSEVHVYTPVVARRMQA